MAHYKIQSLNIFPVKSLRGISVAHIAVGPAGFIHDRDWMLIDSKGNFLTQRQLPRMSLIDVAIEAQQLVVSAPEMDSLTVPIEVHEGSAGEKVTVKIWSDHCTGIVEDQCVARWFRDFLGVECRLVRFDRSHPRQVDQSFSKNAEDEVHFADGFPFLIIGSASLRDLNRRLVDKGSSEVPMIRFRPNIVVETDVAFIEDSWKDIQIANIAMKVVKPCSRCVIPTIDISTGLKSNEPIETLKSYRRCDGKIFFGQNLIHRYSAQQTMKVGDILVC